MTISSMPTRGSVDTADILRALMTEHRLKQRDVAALACVSVKTVEGWLAERTAASWRNMHPRHLHCIRLGLPGYLKAATRGRKV